MSFVPDTIEFIKQTAMFQAARYEERKKQENEEMRTATAQFERILRVKLNAGKFPFSVQCYEADQTVVETIATTLCSNGFSVYKDMTQGTLDVGPWSPPKK